ncbi:MAG: hypothetical protein ACYC0X_00675 [Pirellulaceae bacterium]
MHRRGTDRAGKNGRSDNWHLRAMAWVVGLTAMLLVHRTVPAEPASRQSTAAAGTEHQFVIELTRKETFVEIPDAANAPDTCVTLVHIDHLPSRYRLIPAHGTVCAGQSVDIVLDKFPGICIRVSVVTRGKELAVKVSPLVVLEQGTPVDFTLERVQRTMWALQRRVKDLQRRVATARNEQGRIDTWLATPGNKPLDLVKAARLRQKLLQRELQACQNDLPFLQKCYVALRKTAELAQQIHGTTVIRFTVSKGNDE